MLQFSEFQSFVSDGEMCNLGVNLRMIFSWRSPFKFASIWNLNEAQLIQPRCGNANELPNSQFHLKL